MTTTAYSVGGTWATWDQGFGADVCRELAGDEWAVPLNEILGLEDGYRRQGIGYPASFGPVAGPPDAQSYADSVELGVDEGVRLILLDPNRFVLAGYSQGAEVVRRIQLELMINGRLQHRQHDCVGIVTFGDPCRQKTDDTVGGGKGWGISKLLIPPNPIPVRTYALPGDIYATTPDGATGDQMHAVYEALTNIEMPLGTDLFTALATNNGLFQQMLLLIKNPIGGVMVTIDSLIRLAGLQAHGAYGPYVGDAVNWLRSLEVSVPTGTP